MARQSEEDSSDDKAGPGRMTPASRPLWLQAVTGVLMAAVALAVLAIVLRQLG